MKNLFSAHPNAVGETYFEHFFNAFTFGMRMLVGGLACIIHAVFPFLFIKTASNYLFKMTERYVERMPELDERMHCLCNQLNNKKNS